MKINRFIVIGFFIIIGCQKPIPRKPIIKKSGFEMKKSIAFNKKLIEKEQAIFKTLMKKDSLRSYIASSHGFWYAYNVKSNTSYLPKKGDELFYSYSVYDIDNQLIYSKNIIKEKSYFVDKQDILEGLRLGLKLMHVGDEITFLFPSNLAFGYSGDTNKIAVNQPLIFKVQLNKINKNESN